MITKKEILQYLHYNPLSKRTEIGRAQTVDSIDYKKAMLMFYEQNNIFVVGKRKNIGVLSSLTLHYLALCAR